jgi:RimJ/RimL family protein N-acetyltransferase
MVGHDSSRPMPRDEPPSVLVGPTVRPLTGSEIDRVDCRGLSDLFEPFLHHFLREALRCDGDVSVYPRDGPVRGIYLFHPAEATASIFTRVPGVARELFGLRERVQVFSDFDLAPPSERFWIYVTDALHSAPAHRFSHPVRRAEPADRPRLIALLKDVYGHADVRWLETAPPERETCFVVDGAGELAGAAWVTLIPGHARFHSLSVRARYRRTGIATDLWHARMEWARAHRSTKVITEISDQNIASRAIAEHGGMRPEGQLFLSWRA